MSSSTWYLLTEISLSINPDDAGIGAELASRLLAEAVEKSGLPLITVRKVENALAKSMNNIRDQSLQRDSLLPLFIRIFSQTGKVVSTPQRAVDELPELTQEQKNSTTSAAEPAQKSTSAAEHVHLGWGHFMLERFVDNVDFPDERPYYLIEIYFYNEVNTD